MRLPADTPLPATMGGYRLVRVLGRDATATTALVHAEGEARVARVFELGADVAAMEAELAVHDALAGGPPEVRQHVAALDDLMTLADGRLALLLAAATGPTLHDLVGVRGGQLELGEAVTALAPLVAVVEGTHALGVTGLPLDPRRIRFAASGAPVIVSVAGATAGAVLPARLRDREPGYDQDHRAVAHLIRAVAAASREPASSALRALAPTARGDRATATALFDLAPPIPVRLDESPVRPAAVSAAVRVSSPAVPPPPVPPPVADRPSALVGAVASVLAATGVPTRISGTVVQALESLDTGRIRLGAALRDLRNRVSGRGTARQPAILPAAPIVLAAPTAPAEPPMPSAPTLPARTQPAPVRRGVVIAGVGGGLSLVLAILLSSITPAASDPDPPTPSASAAVLTDGATEPSPGGADTVDGSGASRHPSGPVSETGLPEEAARPDPGQWQALVTELVRRWEECRARLDLADASGSDGCADAVVQTGSAAHVLVQDDDPRHGVLSAWLARQGDVVVVERMGAAVLIDLVDPRTETTAASLLLMRSEAGWRVRDVLD